MPESSVKGGELKIGDILVQCGLINEEQLTRALRLQGQTGGRLGSILYELGYLTMDELLEFLGNQFGVSTTDLYQLEIDPEVLRLVPFDTMKKFSVLPLAAGTKTIFLAMVDPRDVTAISEIQFMLGKTVQPVAVPHLQMAAALKLIEKKGGRLEEPLHGSDLAGMQAHQPADNELPDLEYLLGRLVEERASDLLLAAGVPPSLKKDNEVRRLNFPSLTPDQAMCYALELMSDKQKEEFSRANELDSACTYPELGRFRINIYRQRSSVSIAIRHLIEKIPNIDSLGLPPWIADFALKTQGLILITGPTGHGKTTTLAAIVDIINSRRKCNIVTIEDPIEYLHRHKASNINQREVGTDTASFHEGLKHVFRQAPDVIVIGEMRDPESFSIAIEAADTGHLVISTLHSNTATSTIDRIIEVFPPHQQQQVRVQLAESFLLIFNQRLIPRKKGGGRVLAFEKLTNTYRIKNLIRDNKSHQIRSMFQQASDDFHSIDLSLAKLCTDGVITYDEGFKFCENPTFYKEMATRSPVR